MMYFAHLLALLTLLGMVSACNTIGGFGQDLSETGKALDKAAYWSQNQIQSLDEDDTSISNNSETYGRPTPIVVEEPDTLKEY